MNAARTITVALLMLASGMAGWWLKPDAPPAGAAPSWHTAASPVRIPLPTRPAAAEPLIAVATDGNVTLRVEQRPLQWVLEEIEAQTGHPLGLAAQRVKAGPEAACPGAPAPDVIAVDTTRLERTLESGTEQARYDTLLQARGVGVELPDERLKTLFTYDPSPRVRQQAFDTYLMTRAQDPRAVRALLEQARYIPDAALQRQAAQQLQQLDELERIDAQSAQRDGF